MNKIVFITKIAKADILKIVAYIAKDNKSASLLILENFYKTFKMLSKFPLSG